MPRSKKNEEPATNDPIVGDAAVEDTGVTGVSAVEIDEPAIEDLEEEGLWFIRLP